VLQFLIGEWIVGRIHTVLQGQVEAGRRLAGTRYTDQDHISLIIVAADSPIVIREGEVRRLNSPHVSVDIAHAMGAARLVDRFFAKLLRQWLEELIENIEMQAARLSDDIPQVWLHEC